MDPPLEWFREDISSMIQSAVGHGIHGTGVRWRGAGTTVIVTRQSSDSVHVHLPLAAERPGPDLNFDLDSDLVFSCNCGETAITTRNLSPSVDFSLVDALLTHGLSELFEDTINKLISEQVAKRMTAISLGFALPQPVCPDVEIRTFATGVFRSVAFVLPQLGADLVMYPSLGGRSRDNTDLKPGEAIQVRQSIANIGNWESGAVTTDVYLVSGTRPATLADARARGTRLGGSSVGGIAACGVPALASFSATLPRTLACSAFIAPQSTTLPLSIAARIVADTIPNPPSHHYLVGVAIDSATFPDLNPGNNLSVSEINVGLPELGVFGFELQSTASSFAAGSTIRIRPGAVVNVGLFDSGPIRYGFFISPRSTPDGAARWLRRQDVPTVESGAFIPWSEMALAVPALPTGEYFLGVHVSHGDQAECNASNNTRTVRIHIE
jgi:hypothetical protein